MDGTAEGSDSIFSGTGFIPGSVGRPAFVQTGIQPSPVPVLISVPHAGRDYPRAVLIGMRNPEATVLKLEDRFIDLVAEGVARETGAATIMARAPRAMIDLNRSADDVDWEMFARAGRPMPLDHVPSHRARSGLGLIPRRLPGLGDVWRQRLNMADLQARMDGIYLPYHTAVCDALHDLRARWGAALLLDLHSMPPLPARGGKPGPRVIIGDRFGSTCHGELVGTAFASLAHAGLEAGHNRPYAGGYVLERHSAVRKRIYAMQVEVDRSCYLDRGLDEPGPGLPDMIDAISGLVRDLACCVAALAHDRPGRDQGPDWTLAAE